MNWENYPNFARAEFVCSHTGKCEMHPEFMERLQRLRDKFGKPMDITSGYRDRTHPAERRKAATGSHPMGRAADVSVRGADALLLIDLALDMGFQGIGVSQKGASRFIHLDDVPSTELSRPMIWSY